MSISNDPTNVARRALFLEFCAQVRRDDPSFCQKLASLSGLNTTFKRERKDIELADALLENTNVTYLELRTAANTKCSTEAMAKYVRTSKRLQHINWPMNRMTDPQGEEKLCCFLHAFQESTSLKELEIRFPLITGPSNRALENMLTHT
jgi:hypothetical protein